MAIALGEISAKLAIFLVMISFSSLFIDFNDENILLKVDK